MPEGKSMKAARARTTNRDPWMLYGAYGYTGQLVLEQALKRGHKPLLAGRSIGKLRALAEKYDLPWKVLNLENPKTLREGLEGVDLVYHAAGPYVHTSTPMLEACIDTATHYIDVTGEISVTKKTLSYDQQAREKGIALISSCGVNAVPTDCLVKFLVQNMDEVIDLEVAIDTVKTQSPGYLLSALEMAGEGQVRRKGKIVKEPTGKRVKKVRFNHRNSTVVSLPLVDLETIFHWGNIPNITGYVAQSYLSAHVIRATGPVNDALFSGNSLFSSKVLKEKVQSEIIKRVQGPSEKKRARDRTHIWVKVVDKSGNEKQAWLESQEGYTLTASIAPRAIERIFEKKLKGALTPAEAFGADFILEMPETIRYGELA